VENQQQRDNADTLRLWTIICGCDGNADSPVARLTAKSVWVTDGGGIWSPRDERRLDRATLERDGVYRWSASRRYGCTADSETYYTDAGRAAVAP
jgi:hypothetical protein